MDQEDRKDRKGTDEKAAFMANRNRRPKIFICYASKDEDKAHELYKSLLKVGADPWFDKGKGKLLLGDLWEKEVEEAVYESDAFVVCLRPNFDSPGFRHKEVYYAIDALKRRPPQSGFIIPYVIEPCEVPDWCKGIHAGSPRSTPSTFKDLIAAINKHCKVNLIEEIREIKYLLGKEHYLRIRKYLSKYSSAVKETQQWNFYFYDDRGVIQSHKAMVRIRIECTKEESKGSPSSIFTHVLLTLKTHAAAHSDGTETRPEKNYDITEDIAQLLPRGKALTNEDIAKFIDSFNFERQLSSYLPPIWETLRNEFIIEGIKSVDQLTLLKYLKMNNLRITANTYNGLVLELDTFSTEKGKYYELEIETQKEDELKRDEYIHLLFATLGIPLVCPARQLGRYPSKVAISLADANEIKLDPQFENGRMNAEKLVKKSHLETCEVCKLLKGSLVPDQK